MKMLNKVPEVTIYFWMIKIMATTVGETAADFLIFNLNLGLIVTSLIMSGLLAMTLAIQFNFKKYVPWSYWLVVVLVSIVGTLVSDMLVDNLGVSLVTTTIAFSLALLVTFVVWYRNEKTLSIHTIYTTKREVFYWAAILFTFALGTSAGDLVAEKLRLGYALSALIFGALIGLVAIAYYYFKIDEIWAFWIAYILTRPFGASTGDLLSQPVKSGRLGYGTTGTSIIFLTTIFILVIYLTIKQKKQAITAGTKD